MKFKTIFIIFLSACIYLQASAQDYNDRFKSIQNDTVAQSKLLTEWNKAQPDDPELYVAYFNFYVKKSMRELIILKGHSTVINHFK